MVEQLEFQFHAPPPQLPQLWTPDDIFRKIDDEIIRLFSEDSRVERKVCGIHARELGDYLCMWANTQPHGGIIFVGVDNKGTISGCRTLSTEQINKIETFRRYCPDARHEFKRVPLLNADGQEDFVIAIRVYYREDKLVETSDGEAFVRSGNEKRRLTESEKREIRINKGEIEYELESVTLQWPIDFDLSLVDTLVQSYISKRRLLNTFAREDVLVLLNLGKKQGVAFIPNLACALVFAKNIRSIIPGARLRITRYEGTEETFGRKLNQVFDTFIDGPLPTQIAMAEQVLNNQIKNFTRLGTDGRFYTKPEYPHDVWLEAIINACVHRSYNLKYMNIFIKMFEDKLVVESPGGFLAPTTAETVYEAHNPRNPYTMEALFYLEFVHCAYEGTRRMRDSMMEANLPPPEFSQKQIGSHQIHVTLKNNVEHRKSFLNPNVAEIVGEVIFATLSDDEKVIINFAAEKGKVSVSDASRLMGKDWHAGKALLEGLVNRKIFELRRKSGKERESSKRYVLRQKGPNNGRPTETKTKAE
jgi:ATP-dependent DNA helicase RecG